LEESAKAANLSESIIGLSISKASFKGGKAGETPDVAILNGQL
jgi:hypothetical protein